MDLHTWQFRKHVFLWRLGLGYATLGFKLAKIIKIENRVARKSRKGIMVKKIWVKFVKMAEVEIFVLGVLR